MENSTKAYTRKRRVLSVENAYIVQSILLSSVNAGIADVGRISGMDSAGKTGTTNNYVDRWYCGFTPYYTGATWYGYDENEKEPYVGNNPSGDIWREIMKDVHKDLETKRFENQVELCQLKYVVSQENLQQTNAKTHIMNTL